MNTARVTRLAVTSGAAALCFGVAAPAVACTVGAGTTSATAEAHQVAQQVTPPTLAQEQAWVDTLVAHRTAWLGRLSDLVSGNGRLTPDQQGAALAWIAKAKAELTQLQSQVDAATSTAQVHGILAAQAQDLAATWWPRRARHFGHPAGDHAVHAVRDQQPMKAHDVGLRTTDDRSGDAGPSVHRYRWEGRHWERHDQSRPGRHWEHRDHWQQNGWTADYGDAHRSAWHH